MAVWKLMNEILILYIYIFGKSVETGREEEKKYEKHNEK